MKYQHTQIGYLMIFVLAAVVVIFGVVMMQAGYDPFILAVMSLILLILASFVSLKVTIDEHFLRIKFGYGIFRRRFELGEIASARVVRNSWFFGWGIRVWFWPYMWIYNISGLDAVEIKMRNGKIYRIGTDEPRKLEEVLNLVIGGGER